MTQATLALPSSPAAYPSLFASLKLMPRVEAQAVLREWAKNDLYFLLSYLLNRPDARRQFVFERCREVQADPNGRADLWFRGGYKSTVITYALSIQEILKNPEICLAILSHTRPIAKSFLRQIKREFENNEELKALFPEILWPDPEADAPTWSEDSGLVVKRKGNPKEATVSAFGLTDGQPTGAHFTHVVYDDAAVRDSVTTTEMRQKTLEAWELSLNLVSENPVRRYVGTRWHYADLYASIIERKAAVARIHAATDDGTAEGRSVFYPQAELNERRRALGPYSFASQMLLDPVQDALAGFKMEWLQYHNSTVALGMNVYIVVDPASAKKKTSDYTALWVVGLGSDEAYTVFDMIRDRLSLTERTDLIFRMVRKWRPLAVGWEEYGLQADIAHIKDRQDRENFHFSIVPLAGKLAKNDRIRRLVPLFEQRRIWLPQSCHKTNYERKSEELVSIFIEEEYRAFPHGAHEDMLDALARMLDEDFPVSWPYTEEEEPRHRYKAKKAPNSWMTI